MTTANRGRRVTHVLNSTAMGGAEMVVLQLGTRLQELGWTTDVVTLRGEGALAEAFRTAGMTVTSLDVPPDRGVWSLQRALRKWLGDTPPAVLHTHNVSPLVAAALALPRAATTRFVHTKHGRARSPHWRGRLLTRIAARRPDVIVAVSRDALDRALKSEGFPAARTVLQYNGIDTSGVTPRVGPWQCRLITVARLEPVKSLDLLLRALAALREGGMAATLTVVGDGSERAALERLAVELGLAPHVTFTGWSGEVHRHLREADLFAMSSRSEGLSLTLLEAMATGLPVVATAVGGNPEVVADGVTGRLVPWGDPGALAGAIAEVLSPPGRAAAMGAAGRERVMARFSLDAMVEGYARLYRDE